MSIKDDCKTLILSVDDFTDLRRIQGFVYKHFKDSDEVSENDVATLLNGLSGVVGLVALFPGVSPIVGTAAAITGVLTSLSTNEKQTVLNSIAEGTQYLSDEQIWLIDHESIGAVKVKLNLLMRNFKDKGFSYVYDEGVRLSYFTSEGNEFLIN
ncbi:hypothetical protein JYG23_00050 [Sedimentibacter sp. zth1]|uniref:hypothetical protein n=1 Tax=Sedimentibacter sp. zth1 TaxID=2816908 RepID=UPI001A919AB6|nr:hypothetical protein [Sedimentibacter sp. zth1]QSX05902.1 hypothetical protein JYG23_00050 [Sedimentibacter sp. zth1]